LETVWKNIKEYKLINENDNIVIGVSGGPDSMALLYSLLEIKEEMNFNIFIAHVNHGVRGEDARADQVFVENKCKALNLIYYSREVDMDGYAKEHGISSEEAGRELRYEFFREILKKHGGGKIAVAHNKNDQAETLLLRILRGTGIDGLSGMDFASGDIIRPLLNVSREEIEEYIFKESIETVLDKTNLVPIYSRNRVRLELIPYMMKNFNPNIVDALWRLSRTSNTDSRFLENITMENYNLVVKKENNHSIILNGHLFNNLDICIRQRILRLAILKLEGSLQGLGEQNITSMIQLFQEFKTGKQLNLPRGILGRVSYNDLLIEKSHTNGIESYDYELHIGENKISDLGISIDLKIVRDIPKGYLKNIRYFDYDTIKGNLRIRNRKAGDKFMPFGMDGTKKIKDYFIDKKIPKEEREKIPLLTDDENIIWILGYATSEYYKVTEFTSRILIVDYKYI
jgi:tRNA(Ile)-lysidine synthase